MGATFGSVSVSAGEACGMPSGMGGEWKMEGALPGSGLSGIVHERYLLGPLLGRGGMGYAYYADDLLTLLPVVVKVAGEAGDWSIERESAVLSAHAHAHFPAWLDAFREDGRFFLVRQWVEGETLETCLASCQGRGLEVLEVLDIALQLCCALDYLHSRPVPIVYHDLKPANILRAAGGHLYLTDFGLAMEPQEYMQIGTPGYAAPEQHGYDWTSPRSDLYGLGATLHELLTGCPSGKRGPWKPLALGQDIWPPLRTLIGRLVEPDPASRPAHVQEVRDSLQVIQRDLACVPVTACLF